MKRYKSITGKDSGVSFYEIGPDFIKVKFQEGETYTYSYKTAGRQRVEDMKKYAEKNEGLSTYISQNRPPYE